MATTYIPDTGSYSYAHLPLGGGGVLYSPSGADLPDYEWEPITILNRNILTSSTGRVWIYNNYDKFRLNFHFTAVGSNCVATMGSLACNGTDFRIQVIDGVSIAHDGTYCYMGKDWSPEAEAKGLWSFDFVCEETT